MIRFKRFTFPYEDVSEIPTGRFAPVTTWACRARRFLLVASLFGCGSHASEGSTGAADKPIAECDAFLSAYEHCLDSLGPAWIAQARVEQTRAAFATQVAQGPAAGQALRKQCVDRLSQLKTTCR